MGANARPIDATRGLDNLSNFKCGARLNLIRPNDPNATRLACDAVPSVFAAMSKKDMPSGGTLPPPQNVIRPRRIIKRQNVPSRAKYRDGAEDGRRDEAPQAAGAPSPISSRIVTGSRFAV